MYSKERNGTVLNPIVQLAVPWWSSHGLAAHRDHDDQLKSLCMEDPEMETGQGKGSGCHFTISCGNWQKPPQSAPPECQPGLDLAYAQNMLSLGGQCYGLFSTYGPQIAGRIMLPLSMTADQGLIYVNAKQYHGIIRRRKSRAKAEMENKVLKSVRKPYLHESRHLHAIRRARGTGGRFLGTKNSSAGKSKEGRNNLMKGQLAVTLTSKAVNSKSKNSYSKDTTCSSSLTLSGPEVTSTYINGNLSLFQVDSPRPPSICSLVDAMGGDRGMVMAHKWGLTAAGAGNCCNLKV